MEGAGAAKAGRVEGLCCCSFETIKPRSGNVQRWPFFQSKEQAERKEKEALLQESQRTRDELKSRAQEALRQWRAKCRRLQKELEEERAQTLFQMDKAAQVSCSRRFDHAPADINADETVNAGFGDTSCFPVSSDDLNWPHCFQDCKSFIRVELL